MISVKKERLTLLMKKPDNSILNSAVLVFKPFRMALWGFWTASIVLSGMVIWLLARINPLHFKFSAIFEWNMRTDKKLLIECMWYSFGMAVNKGLYGQNKQWMCKTEEMVMVVLLMGILLNILALTC